MSTTQTQTRSENAGHLELRGTPPTVDHDRLNSTLQHSCQWGATDDGGMNRLALNDDDATVKRWFIEECKKLDCNVTVDAIGNIFAVIPGQIDSPPIAMGSHLDTQPTGGRYDGILGVQAGLEALRAVRQSGYVPRHPLAVICWTNEEGSRWAPAMVGSAVWAEVHPIEYGHSRTDVKGITLGDELKRHGFLGETRASYSALPIKAHFELHIEQGPILEGANEPVCAVSGVQAFRWFDIKIQGRGSHAGTTPMALRKDPLSAFAAMALAAERLANQHGGLATIGRMGSFGPQSTNCILDDIEFHLDIRHHEDAKLDGLEQAVRDEFAKIAQEAKGVKIARFADLSRSKYVKFDELAVSCVKAACKPYSTRAITSGAGHDSVHTAKHCPTAMIFIRCKDGISHHPSEYSTPEDITVGAKVLLEAVLEYDLKVAA